MPAIKLPKDNGRVVHAAQHVLAYYFQRVNGLVRYDRYDNAAVLIATKSYHRQRFPMTSFGVMVVMALNNIRNGRLCNFPKDDAERLVGIRLHRHVITEHGQSELQAAMLLAGYIDRHDIDMRMAQEADDQSGVVAFCYDDMAALDSPFTAIKRFATFGNKEMQTGLVKLLPDVDVEAFRPIISPIAEDAVQGIRETLERDPEEAAWLTFQIARELEKLSHRSQE
ncbi:hypothetical protein [Paracoccus ravus]|uniref:hypothetical protein n=1 Tax=Paracoccus ravus TaxID=2447760 RepID=UPI00106EC716|nr:hypothetical protein [Paracoccus ravus]